MMFSSSALCDPFLATVPTDNAVTVYKFVFDGVSSDIQPSTNTDGKFLMVYDLVGISNGVHSGTVQAVNELWGLQTSAVPFEFTKPDQLTDPVIELVGKDPTQ